MESPKLILLSLKVKLLAEFPASIVMFEHDVLDNVAAVPAFLVTLNLTPDREVADAFKPLTVIVLLAV